MAFAGADRKINGLSANTGADLVAQVPPNVPVMRCSPMDAARHLAIKGRYWSAMRCPTVGNPGLFLESFPDCAWSGSIVQKFYGQTFPIATGGIDRIVPS